MTEDDDEIPDRYWWATPEYETWYWLTNTPTIEEMRRLNRETLFPWPLAVLMALIDAGVDIDAEKSAVLKQVVIERPDAIRMAITCRLDGKPIAVLGLGDRPDGFTDYFAVSRRRRENEKAETDGGVQQVRSVRRRDEGLPLPVVPAQRERESA